MGRPVSVLLVLKGIAILLLVTVRSVPQCLFVAELTSDGARAGN